MLPPFYQTHLENKLEPSEFLFFNIMINILQELREISLEKIATALPIPILFESRRKKVQRFLSLPSLNIKTLWFPMLKDTLAPKILQQMNLFIW